MTVVDVNTGRFTGAGGNLEETVTRNNLEAAEEIVRQLRLRDIGGIIVVDFIDMVLESNRDLVLRRLVECLGRDRTRHQVAEVTSLGLVQMTRKRIGTGLVESFSHNCEHCQGRGVVIEQEPVEPRQQQDDEPRRGGRRGRDDVATGNGSPVGIVKAPSPKDIAAMAKHEPRPVEPVSDEGTAAGPPLTGGSPAAGPVRSGSDARDTGRDGAPATPEQPAQPEPALLQPGGSTPVEPTEPSVEPTEPPSEPPPSEPIPRTSEGSSSRCPNCAMACRTSPAAPPKMSSLSRSVCGWRRNMKPSISVRPASRAACTARSAPPASREKGFSHSTCLPAASDLSVHSTCIEFGSGM